MNYWPLIFWNHKTKNKPLLNVAGLLRVTFHPLIDGLLGLASEISKVVTRERGDHESQNWKRCNDDGSRG